MDGGGRGLGYVPHLRDFNVYSTCIGGGGGEGFASGEECYKESLVGICGVGCVNMP